MEPGEVFHEKYRVESHLGSGGQSEVYRAEEIATGRRVAIKLMRDGGHGVRFIREGRVVSKLQSAHVVRLIEFDRAPSGQFFMVFEFVAGETLGTLARREAPLPWPRVANMARQMLEALAEAHEHGIIHRDIKPSNVMLAPGDEVKVLDFGVAKLSGGDGRAITATGEVLGTPRYVSPEALRGDEVTPRADVFAVGMVAWELLAGRPANEERNSADIVLRHLDDVPYRLPSEVEISPDAKRWIETLCHKNPLMRPCDAIVALAELGQFQELALPEIAQDDSTGEHERPEFPDAIAEPFDPTDTIVDAVPAPQQPPPQPKSKGLPSSIRLDPSRSYMRTQPDRSTAILVVGIVCLVVAIAAMTW